ncbi:LysM peptidoglycan-binding domain-containing NlpC/P60 family protein [Arthrobacter sp. NamB2]|uniref:C40 family peptidase n=1 Tax=Arthrobacter sp. NamB2 TaxID=2576035 RepID=UPI0010C99E7E|nr:LysM peptidoglycan-binding domain-containing protein [Arthrobacter sp. NamB2]TKV27335.1 LysM peptidoglycan-binding domain-containing NlpC/P60 family protein [Arthrobacter sp. NamB2]
MSRNTPARHRAATDGNLALQSLSRAVKGRATAVGRPVAIVAVTSGLALTAVGTAHAGSTTEQGTTSASAAVAAPVVPAPAVPTAVAPAAAAVAAAGGTHTVVPGDTLGGISASYGVDLVAVLSVNSLSVASIIFPGDSITIPAGDAVQAPTQSVTIAAVPTAAVAPAAEIAPAQQAAAVAAAPAVSTAAGSGMYLASADVTPVASTSGVAGTLVASAQSQLAAGAVQDCTVLVEKALRAAGISVGDLGPSQFFQFGATVATPAPGDIVITGGHVAIYVGGGQVISSGMNGSNLTLQHPLSDLPGASFVRVAG